ncbi:uncharacterized protein LOC126792404 [Argentina anserina]|uniref:uncharacterized protein LOC126792404 n=1 Tax=Argentina anserina TaxID=57926 RepID=UPI0021763D01|nr:uncharacterized protein LOC126792404 [Potentilla anserina]
MEIAPSNCYDNLKRYWRRRRYQRLHGDNKKKMRVVRLGGGPNGSTSPPRRSWRLRTTAKLRLIKCFSPINLFTKLHGAYVDMMVRTAGNVGGARRIAGGSKKVAKARDQISMATSEEAVDTRLVLEIYKRLAASRQLADAY